jgi:mannose-P-dolichol utilization defect protein 1
MRQQILECVVVLWLHLSPPTKNSDATTIPVSSAFGENVSLLCQNVVLISLCWSYSNKTSAPVEMQEKVSVIVGFLLYNMAVLQYLPEPHWSLLMSSTWPVMMYARCSQIWGTFQAKSTGNLSIATTSMNLVGACIRILTTLQETGGDFYVLGGYLLSGSLSFIMFGQYWLYLKNTLKTSQEEKAKKAA